MATQVVNEGRAAGVDSARESKDDGIVGQIPYEGRGGAAHTGTTAKESQGPEFACYARAHLAAFDECKKSVDDPARELPSTHDLFDPANAESLECFALISENSDGLICEFRRVGLVRNEGACVGGLAEHEMPQRVGGAEGWSLLRTKVEKEGCDVGAAGSASDGRLEFREFGFDSGSDNTHERGTEKASKAGGELQWALSAWPLGAVFLGNPEGKIDAGAEGVRDGLLANVRNDEGLSDEVGLVLDSDL